MRAYRWCWASTWLAVLAVPMFFGIIMAPPSALFCLGALAATVAAVLGWHRPTAWLGAALAMVGAAAATWWLGPAGLGLLLLVAATSPVAVTALLDLVRRQRARALAREDPISAERLSVLAQCLGDARLCAAWSESYVALRLAHTPVEQLELVNLRQAYLDELEARNGPGFRTWLESGARPVGNPRAYIVSRPPTDDD